MKYQIIVMDPPWDYNNLQVSGNKKSKTGAISHYQVMKTKDIYNEFKNYINEISDDNCLIFMWTTAAFLEQAILLGNQFGFKYVHMPFVWDKINHNPGFYTLNYCEFVLCFKKGKIPTPRGSRKEKQLVSIKRTKHSEKPDEVYNRIYNMFPTLNKLEMFARKERKYFDVVGNEIKK